MGSNSLRGGKNVYGPHCLQSNWFEERFEPATSQAATMKLNQLPSASAKTWTKTSETYGDGFKEAMAKKTPGVESENWMNYQQTDSNERYATTSAKSFMDPAVQTIDGEPRGTMSEDQLKEYRAMWTQGDAARFHREAL
eukprot:CAMPEP_0197646588 /NCGR_PEP_ID=MMETSP1338-20131121/23738_1 /TAXON_ID=43686 ORGANISM="Pelagodinium beii, Strain RCC1491" /NCGR_SAMPLE_ID=MMETSP1338 /ASSEMBLY_ACC=CAM_ASM_000754 /LENGTH=138 /DNA_ID=CAMNT_0043220239 /DNA_START=57 /DNA_END=473 /DNA_ORIENTATION=-